MDSKKDTDGSSVSETGNERRGRLTVFYTDWKERYAQLPLRGLKNDSNECYRNSVLTALLHIPAFLNWLDLHRQDCRHGKSTTSDDNTCLPCRFAIFAEKYWSGGTKSSDLHEPLDELWNFCTNTYWIDHSGQQDTSEFLDVTLQHLQSSLEDNGNTDKTLQHMFRSVTRIQTECERKTESDEKPCGFVSFSSKEIFNTLVAEIPEGKKPTIEKAIESASSMTVEGYQCDKCKNKVNATRRMFIRDAPEVLIVNIRRVKMNSQGKFVKAFDHVSFTEDLDLTHYLEKRAWKEGEKLNYKLSSVVSHQGASFTAGHYKSSIKRPNGEWKCLNDEMIEEVRHPTFFTGGGRFLPYLLIYTREPSYSPATAAEFGVTSSTNGFTVQPTPDDQDHASGSPAQSPQAQATTPRNGYEPEASSKSSPSSLKSQNGQMPPESPGVNATVNANPAGPSSEPFRWEGQLAEIEVRVTMGDMFLSGVLQGVLRKAYKRPSNADGPLEYDRPSKRTRAHPPEPLSIKTTGISDVPDNQSLGKV